MGNGVGRRRSILALDEGLLSDRDPHREPNDSWPDNSALIVAAKSSWQLQLANWMRLPTHARIVAQNGMQQGKGSLDVRRGFRCRSKMYGA